MWKSVSRKRKTNGRHWRNKYVVGYYNETVSARIRNYTEKRHRVSLSFFSVLWIKPKYIYYNINNWLISLQSVYSLYVKKKICRLLPSAIGPLYNSSKKKFWTPGFSVIRTNNNNNLSWQSFSQEVVKIHNPDKNGGKLIIPGFFQFGAWCFFSYIASGVYYSI